MLYVNLQQENNVVVPVCGYRSEMAELEDDGVDSWLKSGYRRAGSEPRDSRRLRTAKPETYYRWRKEVRAWTIPVGATAPKAAANPHDFEKASSVRKLLVTTTSSNSTVKVVRKTQVNGV